MSGDNSEEARARLQKLNVELDEAQQDLKDTEYDKWLSDQEDMFDNLSDEMEDFLEGIINDLKSDINSGMNKIMQAIENYPEAVTNALDGLGLGNALSIITEYNKDGTHTNNWIDYGGNSYSSTYDEYGNPISNNSSSGSTTTS